MLSKLTLIILYYDIWLFVLFKLLIFSSLLIVFIFKILFTISFIKEIP